MTSLNNPMMKVVYAFCVGFVGMYLITTHLIHTIGFIPTAIFLGVVYTAIYVGKGFWVKEENKREKESREVAVENWLDNVDKEYKKIDNVDKQLTTDIYSHKRHILMNQRQKYIDEATYKIMRGFNDGN